MLHIFLDDFRGIMAGGNRFLGTTKKLKILQIIIGVWNLVRPHEIQYNLWIEMSIFFS